MLKPIYPFAFQWFTLKTVAVTATAAAALLALSGCTPAFDWRSSTLNMHGERVAITFPGKSLTASKTVQLNEQPHVLTLHGVQVDSAQFVLGSVAAQNAAQAELLARALAAAFAQNLNAAPHNAPSTPINLAKAAGAFDVRYLPISAQISTPANAQIGAQTSSQPPQRYAQARFFWTQRGAYELLAVGFASELSPENADTFIRSLTLE